MLQIQCKMSRDATSVSNPSPYSIYDAAKGVYALDAAKLKMFIMIIIINVCIKAIAISSFMLCSFGTSTEASAPAVLSLLQ